MNWIAHETATRTAIKDGKRTVAYVAIGAEQYESLLAAAPELLKLAKQYASECGECAGVGITVENLDCEDCKFIRDVIGKAEGKQ